MAGKNPVWYAVVRYSPLGREVLGVIVSRPAELAGDLERVFADVPSYSRVLFGRRGESHAGIPLKGADPILREEALVKAREHINERWLGRAL
jgi:hypothetical protein